MQPLRVEWTLVRPVVARAHELHLDSLLAWARVQEAGGDWSVLEDLPLERETHQGEWVFKASVVDFASEEATRLVHMVRRTDPTQISLDAAEGMLVLNRATISMGSGELKGYSWHVPTQACRSAKAWCVGDLERVTELLGRVRSLGKMARNCFGEVDSFQVLPADEADRERWAVRAYPGVFSSSPALEAAKKFGWNFARAVGRAHPPYWHHEKSMVLEPILQIA